MSAYYKKHVFICTNQKKADQKCCAQADAEHHFDYLKSKLLEAGAHGMGKIRVSKSGCLGRCSSGPCMLIYPAGTWYTYSTKADLDQLIEQVILKDDTLASLSID